MKTFSCTALLVCLLAASALAQMPSGGSTGGSGGSGGSGSGVAAAVGSVTTSGTPPIATFTHNLNLADKRNFISRCYDATTEQATGNIVAVNVNSFTVTTATAVTLYCVALASGSSGAGSGTVTSVSMTGDNVIFNTAVTGSGGTAAVTLVPSLKTQVANCLLAGPTSGGATAPTCRAMVSADLGSFTLNPSFNALTVQPASDVPTATFRRFSSSQASCILQMQTEGSSPLTCFDKTGNFNGSAASISGNLTGDITSVGMVTTHPASGVSAGSCGDATHSCGLTINAAGHVTVRTNNAITGAGGGASQYNQLSDCLVVRTSSTVLTVTAPCIVRNGNNVTVFTTSATLTNTGGSGTARLMIDFTVSPARLYIVLDTVTATVSGMSGATTTGTAFPVSEIAPIGIWTSTSGAWDVLTIDATDLRAAIAFQGFAITGAGLTYSRVNGVVTIGLDTAVAPLLVAVPGTVSTSCTPPQFALDLANNFRYDCMAANTWRRVAVSTF